MTTFSLDNRFSKQGTLSEPGGIPDPGFALQSAVYWMRSYRIITDDEKLNFKKSLEFYQKVNTVKMPQERENSIFEHLLLAIHQLSALRSMIKIEYKADVARVATVAWYYGIYANIVAMVAAQDGVVLHNHTKTANSWDRQFVINKKIPYPFNLRISTLVEKDAEKELDEMRRCKKGHIVSKPFSIDDAHKNICGYLSGTRNWWAGKCKEDIIKSTEFRNLRDSNGKEITNFRTKKAQQLRDKRFQKQPISFAHQAIRFRGKANYREALYLAYGVNVENIIAEYISDMANVLDTFTAVAGAFCFARMGNELQGGFLKDIDKNRSFSLDPYSVWS